MKNIFTFKGIKNLLEKKIIKRITIKSPEKSFLLKEKGRIDVGGVEK